MTLMPLIESVKSVFISGMFFVSDKQFSELTAEC